MKMFDDYEPVEDCCGHAYEVMSFNAPIDLDPEDPLAHVPGPWMLLECRICHEQTLRQDHIWYHIKYEVIPALLGDTARCTPKDLTRIQRYLQACPDYIWTVVQREITLAQERYRIHSQLAQQAQQVVQRLAALRRPLR